MSHDGRTAGVTCEARPLGEHLSIVSEKSLSLSLSSAVPGLTFVGTFRGNAVRSNSFGDSWWARMRLGTTDMIAQLYQSLPGNGLKGFGQPAK